MLNRVFRDILIRGYESGFKRRATFRYWAELERSQWQKREELERLQLNALKRLLEHAAAKCPSYRDAWAERGLDPREVRSLGDFLAWPLIDREEIRAHRTFMRAPGERLIAKATGGSSGVPLQFDLNHDSNDRRMAAWHRGYRWAGGGPGAKELYLWSVVLGDRKSWKKWKDTLYNRLYRRRVLNTFELSEEHTPSYLRRLNDFRPEVIVAYTHSLYVFARSLEDQRLRPFSPRAVIVGAEKLYPFQREVIERVFRAPVFETYGSREFMLIGAECERHEGLHLTMENLLVEVLDDEGQPTPEGQEGNVVVTDLYNYGMPFIRYVNGDRAIAGWRECSCGRGLPTLREVVGRRSDMIHTPDGRHVSGVFFPHLLKDYAAVRQFQVVQERPEAVEIRLVLNQSWTDRDQQSLERQLRQTLGDAIEIKLVRVQDIPLTRSGKLQVVVNRCGRDAATECVPNH